MAHKKWTDEEVFEIVMEGIRGNKNVTDICRERGISQTQYYKWRDMFLEGARFCLKDKRNPKNRDPLLEENRKLKQLVGEYVMVIEGQKKLYQYGDDRRK